MSSLYIHFTATPSQIKEVESLLKVEVLGNPDDLYFNLLDCEDWEEDEAEEAKQQAIKNLVVVGCKNIFAVID